MTDRIPYTEIVEMLRDHAETIAFDMLDGARRDGKYVRGDCHGKAAVHVSGSDVGLVGLWQGQRQGASGGNLIHLIEIAMGFTTHGEAVKYAKQRYLGLGEAELTAEQKQEWARSQEASREKAEKRKIEAERQTEARKETVREIWNEALPAPGTLAETYLRGRVANLENDFIDRMPSIRFHPSLWCEPAKGRHPALVGGVQGPDKALIALWRIFLTPEGENLKVDGRKVKLGFGPAKGGAVRLGPVTEELLLCEGIETGYGVLMINKDSPTRKSVWPCLSTAGLIGFEVPAGVKRVSIWCDGDRHKFRKRADGILPPPGRDAAEKLAARLSGQVEVKIVEPPAGSDWLDVWNSTQEDNYGERAVQYKG